VRRPIVNKDPERVPMDPVPPIRGAPDALTPPPGPDTPAGATSAQSGPPPAPRR
jgi:hypothetical protein